MSKTHKKCKGCGISKPIYRFNKENICFACSQKAAKRRLEKEFRSSLDEQTAKPESEALCLHCKKPLGKERDGAYHAQCRGKRNRQADEHAKRYA